MKVFLPTIFVIIIVVSGWFLFNQTKETENTNIANIKELQVSRYNWSTMQEGPFRDKISFARSSDLIEWTDSQEILAEHASVPGAVIKGNVIYVYFVDVSKDGIPERLGLIRSQDMGKTWLPKVFVTIQGLGNKVPVDPALVLLDDGKIRLYYFDIEEGRNPSLKEETNKIYSAVSSDGINFTQEDGIRFQKRNILDPAVIKYGDIWRMYTGDVVKNQVIAATSNDGLTFTEQGVAFKGGAVPDVLFAFETFFLFTAGINIATSQDGKIFSSINSGFRSKLGSITADPSVIVLDDATYIMFYKTK